MQTRRAVLAGTASLVALALLPIPAARAATLRADVAAAIDAVLAGREALEEGFALELPRLAENGAQVPLTLRVDSPMTQADHVEAIHVFATANPTPGVAVFRLTPASGRAEVSTRIRLAEGQEVIALAELSDGRVLRASGLVSVTVGGCAT